MQNETRQGGIVGTAGEDLSAYGLGANTNGGDHRLVKLANNSGEAVVLLPDSQDDTCLYLLTGGAAEGEAVSIEPLDPSQNRKVTLKGTCVTGDDLVLALISTPADKGKLRKLPATPGTYVVHGKAEQSGEDGQQVKFRPHYRVVTIN